MNDILSITVDATIKNGTREKKCAAILIKMRGNEQISECNIINEYPIFKTFRKTHGYGDYTRL